MRQREIKFRAWSDATEKMIEWETIRKLNNLQKLMSLNHIQIMQFTGLIDRNGKEIYEDDVVKILRGHPKNIDNTYVVEYINAAFQMMGKGNKIPTAFVTYAKQCVDNCLVFDEIGDFIEIIGNIHESPSLLTNQEKG